MEMDSSNSKPPALLQVLGPTTHADDENGDDISTSCSLELEPTFTELDELKELAALSIAERVNLEADLHGVTSCVPDLRPNGGDRRASTTSTTCSTVAESSSLSLLEFELSKLPLDQTAAYRRATIECLDQVSAERKMAFLECEKGDARLAAKRLARYWQFRLDLWGPDRCFLPMTLAGAMRDEVEPMVNRCLNQVLPVTDTSGRAIIFGCPNRRNFSEYSIEQEFMALVYLFETIIENPDLRMRGIVCLVDGRGIERKHVSKKLLRFAREIELSLPICLRAIHMCHPSTVLYYVIQPVVRHFMGKEFRLRNKLHYGSEAKVLSDLEAYCLPRDRVPRELGGNVDLDLNMWVTERMVLESERTDSGSHPHIPRSLLIPAAKRPRIDSGKESTLIVPTSPASAAAAPASTRKKRTGRGRGKGGGRGKLSDPRMAKAVEIKQQGGAKVSLYDALVAGGFSFSEDFRLNDMVDTDGITLTQRKNNLCRRLRIQKKKEAEMPAQAIDFSACSPNASSLAASDQGYKTATMSESPPTSFGVLPGTASHSFAPDNGSYGVSAAQTSTSPNHYDCTLGRIDSTLDAAAVRGSDDSDKNTTDKTKALSADNPAHQRRDSFYDSIMELPGIDDVGGIDISDVEDIH
mmetsp:Transcript_33886/g.74340  ORF Transcript_33886/g.74340 Transcript_33886/m.74340 type:complete len:637 (+) Transcript_33886:221-2131(+)|eukprot:CAMPEP_0178665024 /NCGR_PEP_ID=MMETSP0698-20121128/29714_1 /TAXON_ID=265572 /ORGANISM="Extubocellulus spinifer, Strain CCMP396" /LENGTH=636 /DNA_ID=CAMNT_0020308273 /DNA_START=240 /DNA_END=2150 /DNA_ORIENTATION=-